MVTKTARTRQPTREMQRRCRRKRRAKMVRRLLYAVAVLLVAVAVAIVLYGGSPLHASAEPQPVAAPADTPVQAEPTAQPAAPGQYVVAIDPGHGGINPNIGAEDWGSEADGVRESDVTLCTAQLLCEKLAADDRFAPLLTADGSTYLKPSERAARVHAFTLGALELQKRFTARDHLLVAREIAGRGDGVLAGVGVDERGGLRVDEVAVGLHAEVGGHREKQENKDQFCR